MRIKSRYLKRHDVHEETAVTVKTSEAAAAATTATAAVTQKLHAVNAPDDDLWTKYLINSAEWYKYASKIVKKAALETTNTSAAEKCLGEQKKGVQSEYGLLVKAISVANTTNIPANATSNNSNHCKHSARVSENSLPAKKTEIYHCFWW